jgi:hypothetical protein
MLAQLSREGARADFCGLSVRLFYFHRLHPQMERWALLDPWQALWFVPLLSITLAVLHQYRKQMLDMDKQLIFEEPSPSAL